MAYGPMSTPRRPAPRSIGTPPIPTPLARWWPCTCYIVIEAAASLPAKKVRGDHLAQQRRRGEARVLEFVEQDVGDEQGRIQTHEVQQRQRAHRVARAEHHADVDVLACGKALLQHARTSTSA